MLATGAATYRRLRGAARAVMSEPGAKVAPLLRRLTGQCKQSMGGAALREATGDRFEEEAGTTGARGAATALR